MRRQTLRPAATLLFAGTLLSIAVGRLHPAREQPNDHARAFAEYGASAHWTTIHLGQFAGMTVVVAGLIVLCMTLDAESGAGQKWATSLSVVSAGTTLALYAVLQAVDGIALKQAIDAWANAAVSEKAARFASAEAIRWIEWGVRSYQAATFGITLCLCSIAMGLTAFIPKPLAYLVAFSGLAYLAQAIVLGTEGFSTSNAAPTVFSILLVLVWTSCLLITAWRPIGGSGTNV